VIPPGVKWLLIVNVALFVVHFLAVRFGYGALFNPFKLSWPWVSELFAVWQLVTYLFLHDPYGFGHILFNMLALFMFGPILEETWGTRRFLHYYFICGVGAGICSLLMSAAFNETGFTIGASGAIYGLLLAFGVLFPDQLIWFFFLFPLKAKYFVMIVGAIAFLSTFGATGGNVSHVAHLGGMLWGYLYLKTGVLEKASLTLTAGLLRRYQDWKLARARRKFQVYMRKHKGSDRDRMVH
jgi:membrane associated rhomboid family serine protease